jgi:dihydrofolate synthase/folylpolyglutamate synthase
MNPQCYRLSDWLSHCERLHPTTIDMGLKRVQAVAQAIKLQFSCPVITVAGTNGKGSTCAMLETILLQAGYRTAVYSSPHLVRFEERLRLNGVAIDETPAAQELLSAFARVEQARQGLSLTYFEFTTLAILACMQGQPLDVAILEVGLGGRLDAVNVVDADCAIITSIDLDHMALLGNDREAIGYEKAGILRAGQAAVVSDPMPPLSVLNHAQSLGVDLWRIGHDFHFSGDAQQWGWATAGNRPSRRYSGLAYPALRGANQLLNASGVLAALTLLRERLPVPAQAVRNGLAMVELPGRFQIMPGQPTLVLDVAHNPHAMAALALNLDAMGFYPATHAVFGAMADKDLAPMFQKLLPLVDHWYLTDLPTPRAARAVQLLKQGQALSARPEVSWAVFEDPVAALQAALGAANPADRIVVMGSFYTVGAILKAGLPKLQAQHVAAQSSSGTQI